MVPRSPECCWRHGEGQGIVSRLSFSADTSCLSRTVVKVPLGGDLDWVKLLPTRSSHSAQVEKTLSCNVQHIQAQLQLMSQLCRRLTRRYTLSTIRSRAASISRTTASLTWSDSRSGVSDAYYAWQRRGHICAVPCVIMSSITNTLPPPGSTHHQQQASPLQPALPDSARLVSLLVLSRGPSRRHQSRIRRAEREGGVRCWSQIVIGVRTRPEEGRRKYDEGGSRRAIGTAVGHQIEHKEPIWLRASPYARSAILQWLRIATTSSQVDEFDESGWTSRARGHAFRCCLLALVLTAPSHRTRSCVCAHPRGCRRLPSRFEA